MIHPDLRFISKINDNFKLPIEYLPKDDVHELPEYIIDEHEFSKTVSSDDMPVYLSAISPTTEFGKHIALQKIPRFYTTNRAFLTTTKELLVKFEPNHPKLDNKIRRYEPLFAMNQYNDIRINDNFCNKVGFAPIKQLNCVEEVLFCLGVGTLSSALMILIMPFILLILPFVLLFVSNYDLTFSNYLTFVKQIANTHIIGKSCAVLTDSAIDFQDKFMALVKIAFFCFTSYQTVVGGHKYIENLAEIRAFFRQMSHYLSYSLDNMIHFVDTFRSLTDIQPQYADFCDFICKKRDHVSDLAMVIAYHMYIRNGECIDTLQNMGALMKLYNEYHESAEIESTLLWTAGFNGYFDCMRSISTKLAAGELNCAKLAETPDDSAKFVNLRNPSVNFADAVRNNVSFSKNAIITGPNASGKTTLLKAVFFNAVFSQQFMCGTYDSSIITPFSSFHSYISIPNIISRDSLFQAECRRCKNIIDSISDGRRHLCIFDELFSSTNPTDAITCSRAFIEYIAKNRNINLFLTTHYTEICDDLEKNKKMRPLIHFKQMDNYKMCKGISRIHGALKIMSEMDYPVEILDNISRL